MKRFETIRQLDSNNGTIRRLARDHEFAGQVVDTLYIPRGAASDKVNYLQLLKQIKNVLPLHGCQQCVQFHEVIPTNRS